MKKVLSLVMCVVMFASMFTMLGVVAGAATKDAFDVVNAGTKNGVVTFNVFLNKNVSVNGVVMWVEYDSAVLEPVLVDGDYDFAYYKTDSYGDPVLNVDGMYTSGKHIDKPDEMVSVGYVVPVSADDKPFVSTSKQGIFTFKFEITGGERPSTKVRFLCDEFDSANEDYAFAKDDSISTYAVVDSISFSTMDAVEITSVTSLKKGLRISWNKVKGAEEYRVYKYDTTDKEFKILGKTTKLSYDDEAVGAGKSATYRVRAVNYTGADGDAVFSPVGDSVAATHVIAPSLVETVAQAKGVKVSWKKTDAADKYRVYRREINADGTKSGWTFLANVAKTKNYYSDTNATSGKHYEYTVRSVVDGKYSAVCVFSDIWFYKAPTTTAKSAQGGVKVSWNAVSGAETYRIYRRYNGTGSWKRIATVKSSVESYIDSTATSGKVIQYAVRAFADNGSSKYIADKFTYVATPVLKKISNTTSGVKVQWGAVKGATSYKVYRKAGSSKYWSQVATVKTAYYTDKNVKSGVNYKYTVRAVRNGVTSGYESDGITIRFLSAPKLTKAVNVSSGIKVTYGKVSGATSYNVYRKVGSGSWKLMGTTKNAYYTDKNVKNGTTYKYTVRAVNGKTLSSFNSKGVSVKCK